MLLHLRSAVADLSAERQPHMLFWCHTCAKSAMGLFIYYKRQSAVCKSALRAFVPAISYRLRTISAPLSASQTTFSRHIGMVLENRLFTLFKCQQTENPQNHSDLDLSCFLHCGESELSAFCTLCSYKMRKMRKVHAPRIAEICLLRF